jgi:Protein of unknown function (DUF3618)
VTTDPSSLESEVEATRERLATTIDELVYRVSPKTVIGRQVATTKARFVDPETGAPRTDNILKVVGGVVGVVVAFAVIRRLVR